MYAEARTITAVMAKELRTAIRYPAGMANLLLLMPLYQLVLPALLLGAAFAVNGKGVGLQRVVGTNDVTGWLTVGMAGAAVTLGVLWGVSHAISVDREQGVLEHAWISQTRRDALVWGSVGTGVLLGGLGGAVLTVLVSLFSGGLPAAPALMLLPLLGLALPGLTGVGYLSATISLRWHNAIGVVDGVGFLLTTLAGVSFPLAILPDWLRALACTLPTTWLIDLCRWTLLDTRPMWTPFAEVIMLMAVSIAWFFAGRFLFRRTERRLAADGDLGQH
jgi:ABC-2 type transport system permease protein